MKRSFFPVFFLTLTALSATLAMADDSIATTPRPRSTEKDWVTRHESMNQRVKQGNVDLLFIGDSITHAWEHAGKDIWAKLYAKRNAVNLGIGGDQTAHVLWRLDNGNIDGISPKLAVIMIGTNNAGQTQTPEQIAAGVKAILDRLQTKLPETKILLLAIFPRQAKPTDQLRQINDKANVLLSKMADNEKIFYLDINDKFLTADGTLTPDIMPDLLHPNEKGYKIWADAIEPELKKLLGE